jgi:hypothetical protein
MTKNQLKVIDGTMDDEFELAQTRRVGACKYNKDRKLKEALEFLRSLGLLDWEQKTEYHLKIAHVNYYPTTGAVMLDGQCKYKKTGLDMLRKVLKREGLV